MAWEKISEVFQAVRHSTKKTYDVSTYHENSPSTTKIADAS
jgi:hypothetical protein